MKDKKKKRRPDFGPLSYNALAIPLQNAYLYEKIFF